MSTNKVIRILIADDHDLYRDGLRLLLQQDDSLEIVGEAETGHRLIELKQSLEPDIILTDVRMPELDGISASKELKRIDPSVRIIALSMFDSESVIVDMLEAGALGYVIKNSNKYEIIQAIKSVYNYQPYYCTSTSGRLAKMICKSSFNPYKLRNINNFTPFEIDIIKLICNEKTSKEMASTLHISQRTIEGYRSKIMGKMDVRSTAGIVIYAIKNCLYAIDEKHVPIK